MLEGKLDAEKRQSGLGIEVMMEVLVLLRSLRGISRTLLVIRS
jgi:hypothetical protein